MYSSISLFCELFDHGHWFAMIFFANVDLHPTPFPLPRCMGQWVPSAGAACPGGRRRGSGGGKALLFDVKGMAITTGRCDVIMHHEAAISIMESGVQVSF